MSWWHRLLRRKMMEEQLEKELRFHLEQHVSELIVGGVDPAEARRRARLALGGPEQVKEECRDERGTRWVEDAWRDFQYALRTMRKQPGFTALAILTLGLGIGASTVMFTVVNGVLLKPLPYPEPERLVAVNGHSEDWNTEAYGEQNVSYFDFLDFQKQSRSLELAGLSYNPTTVTNPGVPEFVERREISSNLFSTLGIPLLEGRSFLPEEDQPEGNPVVILSYSYWKRQFGGSAKAVGESLTMDQKRYIIVGVTPSGFRLEREEGDVFTPIGQNVQGYMRSRRAHPVLVYARLQPGFNLRQAQTEMGLIGGHLSEQFPDTNRGRSFVTKLLRPHVQNVRSTLWLLQSAVSLVLLIACANLASLLLARAISRERELGMRMALGASRGRLARQCFTESAVLGLFGGLLGVGLAAAGVRPFVALWPGDLPRAEEVQLDWRVLLFALFVSVFSGFLFGLAPALRAPFQNLERVLRAGSRSLTGSSRRLHGGFVISEIAIAVVLLVAAGMLGRTLIRLTSLDPGVDRRNVLVARMAISPSVVENPERIRAAWQDVLERGRRVPGVQAIATVDTFPMREGNNQVGYWTNADVPPEEKQPLALAYCVSPDYLQVMGISLRSGRFFDEHDRPTSAHVIVVDEVLAQQAFGTVDVVGKRLWIESLVGGFSKKDADTRAFEIVGVVGHVRQWGLASDDQAKVRAQFYYPLAQLPDGYLRRWSELMSIAVRTSVQPLTLVESLRRELRGAAGDQVIYEVRTLEQLAKDTLGLQRFLLLLFGIFAGLALLLACVGIYGVLAYLTNQRVPEMGVRIALGASSGNVIWLVLRQSLTMVAVGTGLGAAAALAGARVLLRFVDGMRPTELSTFAIVIPVFIVAALSASFLPAHRASRVDPVIALRQE
jgi:predicted permease